MEQPQLLTRLEPELLRGVSLHECLSGFGRHWRKPDPGMSNINPHDYDLSRAMEYFDDFLSHDWGTSRFLKLASMLIIYNSGAALVATLLVAVALATFRLFHQPECRPNLLALDQRLIAVGTCHGIHLIVLCFWQRVRTLLFTPRFVFLDKLCIAQSPELADLKAKGILGLAAFLHHSRRLVVLWSPRYFRRLWCSYEIATFLADGKQKPLVVMPAHAGLILVLGYVTWSGVANTLWYVLHVMDADQSGMLLLERHDQVLLGVLSACLLVAFFSVPLLSWGIDLAQNAQLVEEQLHTFRMQDTLCFCCSNQHRHPDTGAEIPCDRELVYLKLKEWYGHPEDGDEDGLLSLSRFNWLVQTRLANSILSSMSNLIPRRYQFYMIAATNMPWLSETLARILHRTMSGCSYKEDAALDIPRWLLEWMTISMALLLGTWWANFIELHVGVRLARYIPRLCAAAVLFPSLAFPVAIFVGSFYYLVLTDPGLLCAIPASIMLVILIMCYSCDILGSPSPNCQSGPAEAETASNKASKADIEIEAASSNGDVAAPPSPSSSCWST